MLLHDCGQRPPSSPAFPVVEGPFADTFSVSKPGLTRRAIPCRYRDDRHAVPSLDHVQNDPAEIRNLICDLAVGLPREVTTAVPRQARHSLACTGRVESRTPPLAGAGSERRVFRWSVSRARASPSPIQSRLAGTSSAQRSPDARSAPRRPADGTTGVRSASSVETAHDRQHACTLGIKEGEEGLTLRP